MGFIIKVNLPEGSQVFSTDQYVNDNGRIKFIDKFGAKKDFPQAFCFIEERVRRDF